MSGHGISRARIAFDPSSRRYSLLALGVSVRWTCAKSTEGESEPILRPLGALPFHHFSKILLDYIDPSSRNSSSNAE